MKIKSLYNKLVHSVLKVWMTTYGLSYISNYEACKRLTRTDLIFRVYKHEFIKNARVLPDKIHKKACVLTED